MAIYNPLKSVELHLHIPGMNITTSLDESEKVSVEDTGTTENTEWSRYTPVATKLTSMELHQG